MNKYCIIKTACNKKETADKIIECLINERLVSGIQTSLINSSYHWDNKVVNEPEYVLEMKTKVSLYEEIKNRIIELHDYVVPEIVLIEISNGSDEFLNWIETETKNSKHDQII